MVFVGFVSLRSGLCPYVSILQAVFSMGLFGLSDGTYRDGNTTPGIYRDLDIVYSADVMDGAGQVDGPGALRFSGQQAAVVFRLFSFGGYRGRDGADRLDISARRGLYAEMATLGSGKSGGLFIDERERISIAVADRKRVDRNGACGMVVPVWLVSMLCVGLYGYAVTFQKIFFQTFPMVGFTCRECLQYLSAALYFRGLVPVVFVGSCVACTGKI